MTHSQIVYLVFGIVLIVALVFDLGLVSKKERIISIKIALWQTFSWILLAMLFLIFLFYEEGQKPALEYLSAYLMEWSLSIDNIFVFILIFNAFKVKEKFYPRVLLIGILMAIVFRVLFITIGVELVDHFNWILYIFGLFLLYTGFKMFNEDHQKEFDPHKNKVYQLLKRVLPLTPRDGNGSFMIRVNHKPTYTILFVVVIILATIDLVFALDSIPAVMGISRERLVIYTSNIFAVLGLRSLFFLLRGAVNKFQFLQQGISVVLVIIGLKMLGEHFLNLWLSKNQQVVFSLLAIILCVGSAIGYSVYYNNKQKVPIKKLPVKKK
jgi:tellurite resistance protein TerC